MKRLILFLMLSSYVFGQSTILDTLYLNENESYYFNVGDALIGSNAMFHTDSNRIYFAGREPVGSAGDNFIGYIEYQQETVQYLSSIPLYISNQAQNWGISTYPDYYNGFTGFFTNYSDTIYNAGSGSYRSGVESDLLPNMLKLKFDLSTPSQLYYKQLSSNAAYNTFQSQYFNYNKANRTLTMFPNRTTYNIDLVRYDFANNYLKWMPDVIDYPSTSAASVGNFTLGDSVYVFTTKDSAYSSNPYYYLVTSDSLRLYSGTITETIIDTPINNNYDFTSGWGTDDVTYLGVDSFRVAEGEYGGVIHYDILEQGYHYIIEIETNQGSDLRFYASNSMNVSFTPYIGNGTTTRHYFYSTSSINDGLVMRLSSGAIDRGVKVNKLIITKISTETNFKERYVWDGKDFHLVPNIDVDENNQIMYCILAGGEKDSSVLMKFDGNSFQEIERPNFIADSLRINNFYFVETPSGKIYNTMYVNFLDTVTNESHLIKYFTYNEVWDTKITIPKYINISEDTLNYLPQKVANVGGYDYYYKTIDRQHWVEYPPYNDRMKRVFVSSSLNIISPLDGEVFFIGDTVEIIYTGGEEDLILTYPLGEIDTVESTGLDTVYYSLTTDGEFQISIASLDSSSIVSVNIVVYPETGDIIILSVNINNTTSPLDVDMSVFTADIDSFRVFYSSDTLNWILIDSWTTDTSNVVNTTNINFDLFLIDGTYTKLYFKAEDARDTTTIIKPRKYHKTGQAYTPDKRICYYYSGHPLFTDWRFDVACQWAPLACYEGGVTLKKDNFVYPKYDPEYADTLNLSGYGYYKDIRWCGSCVNLEGQTVSNSGRCYSLFITNFLYSAGESVFLYVEDSLAGWYINSHKVDGSYTISPTHSYFSVTNQSYVYKGYQYWIDKTNSKVYVNDLVNNIDSILFCDYSDLHTSIIEWVPPYFPTKDVSYAFSIFPYSKLYEHFYFSNYAWNITQEDLDILFNNQTILNTFVPELRIVDGGFNRSISIPLMGEPNDGRPLAYDIYLVEAGSDQWSGIDPNTGIIITRDYFRGIKPRANRHQKYPYNLKGR